MDISYDLLSQLAKTITPKKETNTESTLNGTVVVDGEGNKYVRPDGSDQLIPVSSTTTNANEGERVTVLIKDHTATVTGNISSPAARTEDVENLEGQVVEIEKFDILIAGRVETSEAYIKALQADKANIGDLRAAQALIAELESEKASIVELNAAKAEITDLKTTKLDATIANVTYATIDKLNAANALITKLQADKLSADEADIKYAAIASLEAANAEIAKLYANVGDINTLMFGSATGDTLHTNFANAVVALLGDAQIKSAMIDSLDAGKIVSGSIDTSKVKMESEDGKLVIFDNTIQISDSNRVRVQIGKDASDDYSISIWDADGNLMFSEGGITDKAIKEAIIRNDMISDDANIDAKKLDISSLFTEINNSSETIKSTKIFLDSEGQTLDVSFGEINTTIVEQGKTISSQGTDISVIQGQMNSKVWQQDIDEANNLLSTQYSELEQDLSGFKTTVGAIYSTKDEAEALGSRISIVEQTAEGLTIRIVNAESEIEGIEVGGRNLLRYTGEMPITYNLATGISSYGTVKPLTDTGEGVKFIVPEGGKGGISIPLISDGAIQNGEEITISFDYRGNMTDLGSFYFLQRTSPNVSVNTFPDAIVSEEEWQHYTYTFSSNYANDRTCYAVLLFYMNNMHDGKWIEIKKGSLKLERGNKKTDWTPAPEDVNSDISDASKTATNFMKLSGSGLVVGDMTGDELGENVFIDTDSVDIRRGDVVLASYGAERTYLGKNSKYSIIDMCDESLRIYASNKDNGYDSSYIDSNFPLLMCADQNISQRVDYTDYQYYGTAEISIQSYQNGRLGDYGEAIDSDSIQGYANIRAFTRTEYWTDDGTYIGDTYSESQLTLSRDGSYLGTGHYDGDHRYIKIDSYQDRIEIVSNGNGNLAEITLNDYGASSINLDADTVRVNGNPIKDTIIEHGQSGIWIWRKYASGVAECWGKYTATKVNAAAVNYSGFYYSDTITVPLPDEVDFVDFTDYQVSGGSYDRINFARGFGIWANPCQANFRIAGHQSDATSVEIEVFISVKGTYGAVG